MLAEIICVGTELLMGQVLNTNAQFLSRELNRLGIDTHQQQVVGDNADRLADAYRLALSRANIIITSGGLGPTVDDITKRVAAKVIERNMVFYPEADEMIRERFRALRKTMTQNNVSQAMFAEGTILVLNDNGTAPGAIVPVDEEHVIIHLPGPPEELEPMFRDRIAPYLMEKSEHVLKSRYIRIFGMGEAEVDMRLQDLENKSNPTLSPYCSLGEVQLRATASAKTEKEAEKILEPLIAEVRRRLGDVIYEVRDDDQGSLAVACVEALKQKGWTIATAESLTGGLISATLVEVPGASEVVKGGFVTYQSGAKTMRLDLPADVIEQYNVVSEPVAYAMAEGARKHLGTDIAVSCTGLAGPGGGTEEIPVGTVFVGISTAEHTYVLPLHLTGNRARIRTLTMKHALNAVRREITKA